MAQREAPTTVLIAIGANAGIAVAKGVVAGLTGNSAMVVETIHSAVDTINECLLLLGEHRSRKPADDQHPFGYGQELYFWSLVVAIVVFGIGGGMGIFEGIDRVRHPGVLGDQTWTYVVLGIAFVLEGFSWSKALEALRATARDRSLRGLLRAVSASKDPAVFVVLFEDSAALIGLLIAFFGTLLGHVFDLPVLDGYASILIGVVLALVAIALASETRNLLIGESAAPGVVASIRSIALESRCVDGVSRILTMHMSPEDVLLNVDFNMVPNLSQLDVDETIERFEARVRERHPEVKLIFVEVDSKRPAVC